MPLAPQARQQIVHIGFLLINIVIPTILQIIQDLYIKEPYHTFIFSRGGWVQELLHGHPKHIQCEFGVTKDVFGHLITELHAMGYTCSNHVSLEE